MIAENDNALGRIVDAISQGQPDAAKTVAAHIRSGGSGRWGDMAMPPQAQLAEADAKRLTAWILSGAK